MSSTALRPGSAISAWIVRNNPIYLVSAVCMLASCVLLANSSSHWGIPLKQLLLLDGTLLLYQVALFGMGSYLIFKRRVFRDGKTLLILDAVFLADITFVSTELLTSDLKIGLYVGIVLFLLGAARAWWVGKKLLTNFQTHRYFFALLALAMLVAVPALLKYFDDGTSITQVTFYGLWWIVGLTLAAAVVADHVRGSEPVPRSLGWVQSAYLVAPFASLIVHLAILHYVYDVSFSFAMLTPVLLALAMVLNHGDHARENRPVQLIMLIVALLGGLGGSSSLSFHLGSVILTPVKLTLAATYATAVYLYAVRYAMRLLIAGAVVGGLATVAPTFDEMVKALDKTVRWLARFLPSSRTGWGILGIIASFALLALGALVSLRKAPEPPAAEDNSAPPTSADPAGNSPATVKGNDAERLDRTA